MIHHGDLFDVLPTLDADSIDACVTDPPYELTAMKKGGSGIASVNLDSPYGRSRIGTGNGPGGFMGKQWDGSGVAFDPATWQQVLRVLKPGAYLVAFSGSRTYHRMACAIEDGGFQVRDSLCWLYGQGFPKNYNLGDGKGTALKPAHEPIALAWKPFKGSIKACHAEHGTAALNIDACRIDANGETWARDPGSVQANDSIGTFRTGVRSVVQNELGRWPPNVVLSHTPECRQIGLKRIRSDGHYPKQRGIGGLSTSGHSGQEDLVERSTDGELVEQWDCVLECPVRMLDEQSGELVSGANPTRRNSDKFRDAYGEFKGQAECIPARGLDVGGASRFFYCAKPSREERDYGCYDLPARTGGEATDRVDGSAGVNNPRAGAGRTGGARNIHPTVKPVELMRWLVRLVTPPNGTVLDPFTGSGTTGMACRYEQRRFIGIEREAEYIAIAERRIAAVAPLFGEASA
jgi:site-specific DNA-methyltransferase (adenine-specific)